MGSRSHTMADQEQVLLVQLLNLSILPQLRKKWTIGQLGFQEEYDPWIKTFSDDIKEFDQH